MSQNSQNTINIFSDEPFLSQPAKKEKDHPMKKLLNQNNNISRLPQAGEMVEGKILKISKIGLFLDLGPYGTGLVYGGELRENRNMVKGLKIGQTISVLVVEPENEDSYVELSLKEANLEKAWSDLKEIKQSGQTVTAKIIEANRGGLVVRIEGVVGFLPVSQLSNENYPRVEGGDKNKILVHLNKFIGKEILVKIIGLDKKAEKLIVSEKALKQGEIQESLKNYQPGDIIEGTVSGIADFGAFIKFGDNLEGLAHISELDWQMLEHPSQVLKENEKVKAQIIDLQGEQVFLSLKSLKQDPWQKIGERHQPGQVVKGEVVKLSHFGAFVQIDKGVHGLVHISEFAKQNQLIDNVLKVGQSYDFQILSLEPKTHKMSLALK